MSSPTRQTSAREELKAYFDQWVDEVLAWNEDRPQATLSEIEDHVRLKRRELMSQVLRDLLLQHGSGYELAGMKCPDCGEAMVYKGQPGVTLETREAPSRIRRAYYYCPACQAGLFPPGSTAEPETGDVE